LLGDVVLKKNHVNGREFLKYSERMTKTRDGIGKEIRKVKPRLYGNGTERDPWNKQKILKFLDYYLLVDLLPT
jgi:hypothetical protein